MARIALPALLLVVACGGSKIQGPIYEDTGSAEGGDAGNGESDADADSDADTDSDADADADSDADADADADSDADADADGGGDGGSMTECNNAWYPVHATGWSKDWDVTLKGESTTGTEEGYGSYGSGGEMIYQVRQAVNGTSAGYDLTMDISCDSSGEGMFLRGWAGGVTYAYEGIPLALSATSTLSPYRKFLPPEYAVGSTGSWSYSYTLTMNFTDASSGTAFPLSSAASGTYSEIGLEELDLFDGTTVDAYKLVNDYALTDSTTGTATPGYIEQWWVKGLGLVAEVHTQDGVEVERRTLTGYTGLTIIP